MRSPRGGRRSMRARPIALGVSITAVGAAAWFAVAATGSTSAGTAAAAGVRGPAPAFSLTSVRGDGPVSLAAADGRPVLLSFFASWCPGCQEEMRSMSSVASLAHGRVAVIGIDVNDTPAAARALLRRDHIGYPVGADSRGSVSDAYRLPGLPTTIFLDADHRVAGEVIGPLSGATARSWLEKLDAS